MKFEVPRIVPLGVPVAVTVRIVTLMLVKSESDASDTRSRPPVAPAVKVWASSAIWRCRLMIRTWDWSRVSAVAWTGAAGDRARAAANTAASEPRPTNLRNEIFT